MLKTKLFILPVIFLCFIVPLQIFGDTISIGDGSYTTDWPGYTGYGFHRPQEYTAPLPGYFGPPITIYKTSNFTDPVPTNDWWSSVVWLKYSQKLHSIPLSYIFTSEGMEVTGQNYMINSNTVGGYWSWTDFIVKGSGLSPEDARLDAVSDWSVDIKMAQNDKSVTARLITGAPFMYLTFDNCEPVINFPLTPLYSKTKNGTVITDQTKSSGSYTGDTIRTYDGHGRYYGWFAPQGTVFNINGGNMTITLPQNNKWLVVGLLALGRPETWDSPPLGNFSDMNSLHDFFYQHAYAWPIDTSVSWNYDKTNSKVYVDYNVTTESKQYSQTTTLQGIFPHQYKNMQQNYSGITYKTVRGNMEVLASNSFTLDLDFHGLMPYLPVPAGGSFDLDKLNDYILDRYNQPIQGVPDITLGHNDWIDTYWHGKHLSSIAKLIPITHITNDTTSKNHFINLIKNSLSDWMTFNPELNENNDALGKSFVYLDDWKALFGFLPGYGSEHFNDQHFHYGYFIYASAILSMFDQSFPSQYGEMIDLIIREIASPNRNDNMFPFLRYMNVYNGHSWANGIGDSASGNDQESVSEALNSWASIALWGMITGQQEYEDLGVFLHSLEYAGAREYWYDIDRDTYDHSIYNETYISTMVWGDHSCNATWFSAEPEHRHGIIYLPITPSSLYLGLDPTFVENDYNSLVSECGGNVNQWVDIMNMYRSFYDPSSAVAEFDDTKDFDRGNSWAFTYLFIHNMNNLGHVLADVTADTTSYAVFDKDGSKNYMAYNPNSFDIDVNFSDGFQLSVPAKSLASTAGIVSPGVTDEEPPSTPVNINAVSTGSSSIQITWDASTDNTGVAGYNLFRSGAYIKSIPSNIANDTGLQSSTTYSYSVSTYDYAGNQSEKSAVASATTDDGGTIPTTDLPPVIYGDAFNGGGYDDFSFNTSESVIVIDDNSNPYTGPYNILFTAVSNGSNANARFDLYKGENTTSSGLNLTEFNGLEFYMTASSDCSVWVRVGVGGNDSGYKQKRVDVTNSWQKYTIDLNTMDLGTKTDINTLLAITIQAGDNGGSFNHTIYVDDIILTGGSLQDTTSPSVPQNLTAVSSILSQIDLLWEASTDNISVEGYNIYRDGQFLKSISTAYTTDVGMLPNTTYTYKITAYDAAGNESDFSNEATITTLDDILAPSVPQNFIAEVVNLTRIDLSWEASTDNMAVDGYKIYRDNSYLKTVISTVATDTGLSPNTTYTYKIKAYDTAGNESGFSNESSASTIDQENPSIPLNPVASASGQNEINISWNASNDNVGVTGYNLYRNSTYVRSVSSTSVTDTGLQAGTEYTYNISAYDSAGNESGFSVSASATTDPPLPDMVVTDIEWSPSSPIEDDLVYFNITVRNQGEGITPAGIPIGIGVWVDDVFVSWSASDDQLSPGSSITLSTTVSSLPWTVVTGDHTVRVIVDDASRFVESDETNNILEKIISIGGSTQSTVTPWKTNENGSLYTNRAWNYTLGYHFTPSADGVINKLGGYFDGTKTVYLWNKSTGELLGEASVTSSNSWNYSDISPVSVTSGTTYTVAAYLEGSGASYRNGISTFPNTYGDITITGSTYASGNSRPTNTIATLMYGQVDISFVIDGGAGNSDPQINSTPVTTAVLDQAYSYDVDATDSNSDTLTYLLTTNPTGMSISSSTGLISWTPSGTQVGDHTVTVEVNDGNAGTDSQTYTVTVSTGSGTGFTPWNSNENGTLYTGQSWDYTLGFHFTPSADGVINKLGGYFDGTKTVYLWNKSTGELLGEASVTSSNSWNYSDISPVSVTSGTTYTVAAYLEGSGASYRNGISTFPNTYGDITITGSTYASGNSRPTNTIATLMYGQVDVSFIAD